MNESNRLSGHEKDKLRKKFGHNRLSGKELDNGRTSKSRSKALKSKKEDKQVKVKTNSTYKGTSKFFHD